MGFIAKLKLLFKIQKPLGELAKSAKDVKTGWKTLKFWVTLTATLASTAAALTGIIPPQAQLIATTILQALYNIIRGAEKMESPDAKGVFTTTEFWLTTFGEIQKGIVAAQTGGINPEWFTAASAVAGMALAAGQNLASREPEPKPK